MWSAFLSLEKLLNIPIGSPKFFFGQDEFLLKCWPTVRPYSLFPNMSCPSFIVKVKINIEQQFGVQFTAIAFKFFSSLMV